MIFARSKYPLYLAAIERDQGAEKRRNEFEQTAIQSNQQALGRLQNINIGSTRKTVIDALGEPDSRIGPFANATGAAVATLFYNGVGNIVLGNAVAHSPWPGS